MRGAHGGFYGKYKKEERLMDLGGFFDFFSGLLGSLGNENIDFDHYSPLSSVPFDHFRSPWRS